MHVETVYAYVCRSNRVFLRRGFELGSLGLAEVIGFFYILFWGVMLAEGAGRDR